ncbi:lysozyme inhibitor LprI family protein [Nitratidesulfovibrio vulgaris]|jgi:uncharacterized protein|uniref:Lysozyme inhibitor LprI-like N-terminal domain-containing protein n=2 Tax=Nitratidesulfovibrio vulgaris TaxID=881 RepID=Q72AY8_NITV2|nr:lysozyme inhibitor LprI family protein [Nitratidesulfovibrio vulgaris]AAS96328.1 conserved hypothetical protein [Nitratidesulfovibrio vulgaris str. Hildenborough]ADP86608.1 protein of unknown function DUF1311 [Nitratidesulfovibrio vulgaris RCH1]WCB45337.1 lysozyme inhibitor LprI family protein [Nitratidesulfovibrio vulgaris]GEB79512.1 hypothetical protein DDE01_09270 [Desulfovibrio desulfuricans]
MTVLFSYRTVCKRLLLAIATLGIPAHVHAGVAPSFDCTHVEAGSIEADICASDDLAILDRQMDEVYRQARQKATDQHPPTLAAEQRGWIKGRNECWKSPDRMACIRDQYQLRIAELQALYRLVASDGPHVYGCDDAPGSEVVITRFKTTPPTLVAERGDSVSLMYLFDGGGVYQGRNETFIEREDAATVTWGYGATPMQCRKR